MQLITRVTCVFMVLILGLFFTVVSADEKSKSAKLNELMELSGMVKIMEQARNKNKTQALQYKQGFMKQLRTSFQTNDPEVWEYFEIEYQKFIDSLEPKWTVEEAVQKYIDLYGARMTEEEIDVVLKFNKSAIGRKSTSVSNKVAPIWFDYLSKGSDSQFSEGLKKFVANLKTFVAEKKKMQKSQKEQ
ncbi:MAG: hypothetical protein GY699_06180 [Desulfobacteraceae bacterium]|nr:hypothetical protein [Desulfobacteraceae bacterium]